MEDLVTYNSSISACATASEWSQALALLSELPQRRLEESFFFFVPRFGGPRCRKHTLDTWDKSIGIYWYGLK